jgi:hypothetical protein
VATSVEPGTCSISKDTEATSSQIILVEGDTQSRPARKSPRLHERDDDEVVVVPPPKVYTIVDLTEEGTETARTMELNAFTRLQTSTRRRGRPCKARPQTQVADKKSSTSKPSQDA